MPTTRFTAEEIRARAERQAEIERRIDIHGAGIQRRHVENTRLECLRLASLVNLHSNEVDLIASAERLVAWVRQEDED